ncbi:hypothetical protein DNI29_09715 [Hymenobacter sediminis]|uniref:hypothetical protein n=1 Tax=Hymenobacter sediminis TaxID=2218621 RepID=UPI000F4DB3A8|nr:hypothetical protein [Hymenobacter sediminis]RPD47711.1 hypothetical protein DNI29_09715 [Hymenobacter sediminis]
MKSLPRTSWKYSSLTLAIRRTHMGFSDFFFGKQLRIEDQKFGTLLFVDGKGVWPNYLEGERLFTPTGTAIELCIEANATGPTGAQRAFYQQIEEQYFAFLPAVQQLVETAVSAWLSDSRARSFIQGLLPVYLSLPRLEEQMSEVEWEMAFESPDDKNHTCTLSMIGLKPYHVHIDG